MTAELQPLDAKIFGLLKSIGAKMWVKQYLFDPSRKFSKETASIDLQNCWEQLSKEVIQSAWKTIFENASRLLEGVMDFEIDKSKSSDQKSESDSDYQEPKKKSPKH
jgi:hypothetical protein